MPTNTETPTDEMQAEKNYIEWFEILNRSIESGAGTDVNEATRMVLCFVAIIEAYKKEFWSNIDKTSLVTTFFKALDRIRQDITSEKLHGDSVENYRVYEANIERRYNEIMYTCFAQKKTSE